MTVFLSAAVGLILTAFVLLQQIALWQRKEYRLDRLRADLATNSPRAWALIGLLTVLAASGLAAWYYVHNLAFAHAAGWLGLSVVALMYLYQTLSRGFVRPKPTGKAIFIGTVATISVAAVVTLTASLPLPLRWYVVILFTPVAAAAAVAAGNGVGEVQKRHIIAKALERRQQFRSLTVIGVTGSYGKTSAKYFLHHLMGGGAAHVQMSADRRNEAFVIAQDMGRQLTPHTKVYIVEMGAYRRGEIARLARLAEPRIALVTAIRNQHLALFGSLAALAAAKWELVASLPPDGIAVLNADDPAIQAKAATYQGRIVWYSLEHDAEVYAENIRYDSVASTFTLHVGAATQTVTIPLPGAGYVSAAVAAAAAAHAAQVPAERIFSRLATVQPIPQTMVVTTNARGSTIVDDSYSANEDGVLMAIAHLKRFSQPKKLIVLRPLIELGEDTARVHAAVGQALADAQAEVYLYDTAGAGAVEQAARDAGLSAPIHRVSSPKSLAEMVQRALDNRTVCLLENRLPDIVRQAALG